LINIPTSQTLEEKVEGDYRGELKYANQLILYRSRKVFETQMLVLNTFALEEKC